MDEKEKEEYENVNKTNIIDEGEKINVDINEKKDSYIDPEPIGLINSDCVDLRQVLTEENFNKVKKDVFFEVIFMTYSYVHTKINEEAFPNSINLYDKNLMTGRGRGKYMYKNEYRQEGEIFFRETLKKYFPNNEIKYIV